MLKLDEDSNIEDSIVNTFNGIGLSNLKALTMDIKSKNEYTSQKNVAHIIYNSILEILNSKNLSIKTAIYSAIGRMNISDNISPRYIFNGIDTIKIFICGIIFDVKPKRTSVINNTPKIGNAIPRLILNNCPVNTII